MPSHREIEAKLEVTPGVAVPPLEALPGVTAVDPPEEFDLEAVYVDTPDLRLARAGVTLRRRTGGADAGWHLKLPVSADERTELQAPLGPADGDVPPELMTAIRARVREAPLAPVVELNTRRTVRRLRDAAGRVLAEVADDAVTSRVLGDGGVHHDSWREWEVELVDGDRALLAAAVTLLDSVGGSRPAASSKLARALGDRLAPAGSVPNGDPNGDPHGARAAAGSAGALLRDHLRALRDELISRDPPVRRDEPEGVHEMRVATRQLRSALATFRPLLVREHSEIVRVELGWLAAMLGAARDAEVGRARFAELLAREPVELVLGPVAERLDADRARAYRAAHDEVVAALDTPRYLRLLDALDALADGPPLTEAAGAKASKVLPRHVLRDWERLAHAMRAARDLPPGARRDGALHEARKSAKRARYAAEVVAPAVGRPAMRGARAAKKLQTLLGAHHDSVELRAVLRRVAEEAQLDGENTFTYGRLHAIEQARAESIEAQLPALSDLTSPRRRRRPMR